MTVREAREFRRVKILGCGSACYAGELGRAADRGPRAGPGDRRGGLGVPLPQPGRRARHALRRGQPVRRDHRHPRRGAGAAAQGRPGDRHRQRRRFDDRTPVRRRHLPPRRPGDVGRGDQVVHLDASRRSRCSRCTWAASATSRRRRGARIIAGLNALPDQISRDPRAGRRDREVAKEIAQLHQRAVRRAPPRLAGGPGGRAEAQGDLLHPRRGLRRRRAQARPARAGQPGACRPSRSCPTTTCSTRTCPRCPRSRPAGAR